MAYPNRVKQIQHEIEKIQEQLAPVSQGAVLIKDPKKRRKCPICDQNLYLYNISIEEMFLMCENNYCDFPFGYEMLQIVGDESQLRENPLRASEDFFEYANEDVGLSRSVESILGATTCTMSSMSCFSDCDQFSQVGDEDLTLDRPSSTIDKMARQDLKKKRISLKNKEVQSKIKQIDRLTDELQGLIREHSMSNYMIKNQKRLQNLKYFESMNGAKILREEEDIEVESKPEVPKITINSKTGADGYTINIQLVAGTGEGERNTSEVSAES